MEAGSLCHAPKREAGPWEAEDWPGLLGPLLEDCLESLFTWPEDSKPRCPDDLLWTQVVPFPLCWVCSSWNQYIKCWKGAQSVLAARGEGDTLQAPTSAPKLGGQPNKTRSTYPGRGFCSGCLDYQTTDAVDFIDSDLAGSHSSVQSSVFSKELKKFCKDMELDEDRCIKMNDGNKIPAVGFGTYSPDEVQKSKCEAATKVAIEVGFRHIDGAFVYGTEEEVGRAVHEKIADGTVKREDIFYTGKLASNFHRPELVRSCLEQSLKKLQFEYLDLFIIHMPTSLKPGPDLLPMDENGKVIFDIVDLRQTWEAMEACKDAGLVKSIGVSNFNIRQLEMILNKAGLKYKPVLNQVECHPYLNQSKLLAFCKSNGILLEAFHTLGSQRGKMWIDLSTPVLLDDPVLGAIAKKYNRSPALIALRYQLQRGIVVLFKSFTRERIEENFQVFDFQLSAEDMKIIDGMNKNITYLKLTPLEDHPQFPFRDE
ncbi:estradiol 17 beta-dehydrogenase 5-like isoform X2 [Pelodiscus sinensis]|uniref:estradiol 17 beta-dehydrogenase 5-like isoform X2 n=1 Tax=Pelodiscus sinensis TaxID=13735 RepID=UPI003F6CFA41